MRTDYLAQNKCYDAEQAICSEQIPQAVDSPPHKTIK